MILRPFGVGRRDTLMEGGDKAGAENGMYITRTELSFLYRFHGDARSRRARLAQLSDAFCNAIAPA